MKKFYHLIEKPEFIYSRHDRVKDREQLKKDFQMMKIYLAIVVPFIFFVYVFSAINQWQNRDTLEKIQAEICEVNKNSLLCYNPKVLKDIDQIAKSKEIPTRLILGVMHAESSLFTNFNRDICKTYNNPFGLKGKMEDNGKVKWYSGDRKRGDQNGCYLFKFESVQEATKAFSNTINIGYKTCNHKIDCIAYAYVGAPDEAEQSWIDRVKVFYK